MNRYLKLTVLSVVLACGSALLLQPEVAQAQTTMQSVQGTWTTCSLNGVTRLELRFNANGTFSMLCTMTNGNVTRDSGTYSILSGVVVTQSNTGGGRCNLFFNWVNPNMAEITVNLQGTNQHDFSVFTRTP